MSERTLPYWQVDAFAHAPFTGNPAAVVELREPFPAALMQALAGELGQPATAFVGEPDGGGIRAIRWFDPRREIALCGHGTLAAGHVLLERDSGDAVNFRAADGRMLEVRRIEDTDRCELALPALASAPRALPELAAMLGAVPQETLFNEAGYALAVFADAAAVEALAPDCAALGTCGWQVTATAPAPPGEGVAVVSRVFTRAGGEDAATGSAHAMLTPYWAARLKVARFDALQASARGAVFGCTLAGDSVRLAGGCVTLGEGRLRLPYCAG